MSHQQLRSYGDRALTDWSSPVTNLGPLGGLFTAQRWHLLIICERVNLCLMSHQQLRSYGDRAPTDWTSPGSNLGPLVVYSLHSAVPNNHL